MLYVQALIRDQRRIRLPEGGRHGSPHRHARCKGLRSAEPRVLRVAAEELGNYVQVVTFKRHYLLASEAVSDRPAAKAAEVDEVAAPDEHLDSVHDSVRVRRGGEEHGGGG